MMKINAKHLTPAQLKIRDKTYAITSQAKENSSYYSTYVYDKTHPSRTASLTEASQYDKAHPVIGAPKVNPIKGTPKMVTPYHPSIIDVPPPRYISSPSNSSPPNASGLPPLESLWEEVKNEFERILTDVRGKVKL